MSSAFAKEPQSLLFLFEVYLLAGVHSGIEMRYAEEMAVGEMMVYVPGSGFGNEGTNVC